MSNNHQFVRKHDKLAIVGSHIGTRDGAPYDDESWDIWVFNEAALTPWCKRWTGVFQMHQEKNFVTTNGIGSADNWSFIQQDHGDKTIWMQYDEPRVPNSVKYPLDDILAKFGTIADPGNTGKGFFTSTPAYALALGLYLGYPTIHTWGVDLSSNTEWTYQAPCWRYWAGVAGGMLGDGFKMIKGGHHLFQAKRYGYDDDTRSGPDFYKERIRYHDSYWATAKKRAEKLKGALIDTFSGKGDIKDFMPLFKECYAAYTEYGKCAGAMGEATRFAERAEVLHRQEFEWHAAKAHEGIVKLEPEFWKTIGHLEYAFNVWAQSGDFRAREQSVQFTDNALQAAYQLGFLKGKQNECVNYINAFDQMLVSAGGGEKSDEILAAEYTKVEP